MLVKDVIFEDFVNYKVPSLFIVFGKCSFKCNKEEGSNICQNSHITSLPDIDVPLDYICAKYKRNLLSQAIVCGGLEPFDSKDDLFFLIKSFRKFTEDDIVIYTGYTEEELKEEINILKQYKNIIVKFGRYRSNQKSHYDDILKLNLASDNQYAKKVS